MKKEGGRVYSAERGRKGLQCRKREEGFTMQEEGGRVYCAGRRGMGRADAISQKSENDHHA